VKVMMLWTARTWRFCRTHGRTFLVLLLPVLAAPVMAAAQSPKDYLVGPNDVLVITVFDQPQLSGKYLVQADGSVTFPLLGRLRAGGMSMQAVDTTFAAA